MSLFLSDFLEIKTIPHYKPLDEVSKIKNIAFLDESFISKARWSEQNKSEYLKSVLQNMCLTPFILVDVASCLKAAKDNNRLDDIEYYQSILDKKKKYITCDSNNRQTTLLECIVNNEITLPSGTYSINGHIVKIERGTFFKDLKPEDQHQILLNRKIIVMEILEATRLQLAHVFDSVNKGVIQNAQELRQSWLSNLGQPIRDLAAKVDPIFLGAALVTQTETHRRRVDEYLVDMAQFQLCGFTHKFSKPVRDSWYVKESALVASVKEVEGIFSEMTIPAALVSSKGKKKTAVVTERAVFQNVFLRLWLKKNNYKIKNSVEFDGWLYKQDKEWLNTAPKLPNDTPNPKCPVFINDEGISYPYKSAGRRSRDFMEWNFNLFMETLLETQSDLIINLDDQRLATPTQKYHIWESQKGKTPNGMTEIPLSELLDHTKWQADHIVRHTDGGKTTLDNLQLISAQENLKKAHQPSTEIF